MGFILKLGFLGFLSSIFYLFGTDKEVTWTVNQPFKNENYNKALDLVSSFKFFENHPAFDSFVIKSENSDKSEREIEIREKVLDLGFYKHFLINTGTFKKVADNKYTFDVQMKFLGLFKVDFKLELVVNKGEVIENAKVKGSYLVANLIKMAANPHHEKMFESMGRYLDQQQ